MQHLEAARQAADKTTGGGTATTKPTPPA